MTMTVKRNGVTLCTTTVPYSWEVVESMLNGGCVVYADGKRITRAECERGLKNGRADTARSRKD